MRRVHPLLKKILDPPLHPSVASHKCRLYLPLVAMAVGQILLKFGSKQELAWGQEQAFSVAEAFLAEMIDCYLCLLLVLHS